MLSPESVNSDNLKEENEIIVWFGRDKKDSNISAMTVECINRRAKKELLNCYESIQCVCDFLLSEGFRNENIIFYGTSIGTGPSVDFCSKIKTCKGLLLQSPYTSIVGVQHKCIETSFETFESNPNIFRNIEKIHLINSRILILHGMQDSLINIRHSEELCAKSKNAKLIKLEHVGHNGIENLHFEDIMKCLNELKF